MRARLRELVLLFDRAYEHKSFKKKEREKLSSLIAEYTIDLIGEVDDDEMEALYEKHGLSDEDLEDDPAFEELEAMLAEVFGLHEEPGAPKKSHDTGAAADSEHTERKPTQRETRKAAEENRLQQSVREIFRKLASFLHPDRESDPAERERKTALMQRANAAYAAQDLLGLLELQFEVEQIDQSALETLDDARIKQYNKVLTRQVEEVRGEIEDLEHWLIYELGISPRGKITPAVLDKMMTEQIRGDEEQHRRGGPGPCPVPGPGHPEELPEELFDRARTIVLRRRSLLTPPNANGPLEKGPFLYRLRRLVLHVVFNEVLARVFKQLAIVWMIDGFNADDFVCEFSMAFGQVLHEHQFFLAWADDQNLLRWAQDRCDFIQILGAFDRAVIADDAIFFMLRGGLDDFRLSCIAREMDDMGFGLVDPDDCVVKRHNDFLGIGKLRRPSV